MAVKTIWDLEHGCGHEGSHDLSAKRPSERAGYARRLATKDCTACWRAKRDEESGKDRGTSLAEHRSVELMATIAFETRTAMPTLDASDKAIDWARQVRRALVTVAYEVLGLPDEEFATRVEDPARSVTSASWWIDQRVVPRRPPPRRDARRRRERSGDGDRTMSRPSPIEAARLRHDLGAVARRTGIDVARTSGSVSVWCPFPAHGHYDSSPSLRLHLDDGIFSCFGCGKRGDVVEWVREAEGVDWRAAIAILDARRPIHNAWSSGTSAAHHARTRTPGETGTGARWAAGAAGESEYPDLSRTPPERVYQALEVAWRDYTYDPLHHRDAAYLARRGIEVGVLENHTGRLEVGHSHASSDGLVAAMRARGFSDDELVDAGLAHRRLGDGPLTDFYRERVLIPLRDGEDRICGFIGRNVGDDRFAKYKNPPRTHAYDKSVNLYQPLSAPATGPSGQVVVVEGTVDAMAIAVAAICAERAGQFCPVTQSGRELSPGQLDYVLGLHPYPPVIAFDGDAAGRESSERVARAAKQRGDRVVVAALPDGHDPASWLAERGIAGLAVWVRERRNEDPTSVRSGPPKRSERNVPAPLGWAGLGCRGDAVGARCLLADRGDLMNPSLRRATTSGPVNTNRTPVDGRWTGAAGPVQLRGRYLTLQQVAGSYPAFTIRLLRRLVEERRIPFSRAGRCIVLAEADIEAYLEHNRVESLRWHPADGGARTHGGKG